MKKTKEKLLEEYNKLEKEIKSLRERINDLNKELREKGYKLKQIRLRENNQLKKQNSVIPEIKAMFKALNNFSYKENLICNHFGVRSYADIFFIDMSKRGQNTQLVIEVKDKWVANEEIGCSKRVWNNLRKMIDNKYKIIKWWNGTEGHYSMSVVLNKKCPKSLSVTLKNYDDGCSNGKGFPQDTFEKIFHKNLKKVKGGKNEHKRKNR